MRDEYAIALERLRGLPRAHRTNEPAVCRHGDDPSVCISCEMLRRRPDKKEPGPVSRSSENRAPSGEQNG